MTARRSQLLLVGGMPLGSVEEVFEICGGCVGDPVASLPDGEVGDRRDDNTFPAYRILNGHPDLETLAQPSIDAGG